MADYKTVYTLNNLSFDECMTLRFGLQARIDQIKKSFWDGMAESTREYFEGELATAETVLSKWEDIRKFEYVEDVPAPKMEELANWDDVPFEPKSGDLLIPDEA